VPRRRPLYRLTVWTFAGVLLLKSAVPMFASLAAHLQGKGVAEVCAVYGVALPGPRSALVDAGAAAGAVAVAVRGDDGHALHRHLGHAMHGDHAAAGAPAERAMDTVPAPAGGQSVASDRSGESPPTHDAGGHGADHCVLTALATFAANTAVAMPLPAAARCGLHLPASRQPLPAADASARWAALLGHGPPRLS